MWPFKPKTPKVDTRPVPKCGLMSHYDWDDWYCPMCAAIDLAKKKENEKEELAELIATKVAAKLAKKQDN